MLSVPSGSVFFLYISCLSVPLYSVCPPLEHFVRHLLVFDLLTWMFVLSDRVLSSYSFIIITTIVKNSHIACPSVTTALPIYKFCIYLSLYATFGNKMVYLHRYVERIPGICIEMCSAKFFRNFDNFDRLSCLWI